MHNKTNTKQTKTDNYSTGPVVGEIREVNVEKTIIRNFSRGNCLFWEGVLIPPEEQHFVDP